MVYSDENVSIAMTQYREYDTDIYVAEVWLSSAQYLKTAFAENSYGKNVTAKTSEIASQCEAILAINGDYYGARESGYVIRNGVVYRDYGSGSTDISLHLCRRQLCHHEQRGKLGAGACGRRRLAGLQLRPRAGGKR